MFKKLVIMLLIIFLIIPSVSVFASNSEQPTAEVIFSHDEAVLDEVIFFVVVIYLPFGNELTPDASNTNRFRFGGMYWDAHRSEYMTPNRMMNPRLGRWTQPDPFFHMRFGQARIMGSPNAIAQAGNLFVFVMNNPVMWRDPTGLFAIFGPDEHIIVPGGLLYQMLRESGQLPTQPQNQQPGSIPTTLICRPTPPPPPPRPQIPIAPPTSVTGSPGQTTFTHEDRFVSKADVVLAFALTYHPQSYDRNWYAWIQMDLTAGTFMFSQPGTATGFQSYRNTPHTAIAWIHTHPHNRGAGEQFTGRYNVGMSWRGDGHFAVQTGLHGFLVTPSGVVRQLCPNWPYPTQMRHQPPICNDTSPYVTIFIESIFQR